jgi:DNA-binding NarL/FixJ family response regulator
MRILLVDDDEGFRATLRRVLTQGGREVQIEEAVDGEDAVRKASSARPDVVLMDLTMPRMNGVEATRQLKTRWPDLPVIILTVHDDPVYERTARTAGADQFLLKKTAGSTLWPTLGPLLSRASSTDSQPAVATPTCGSGVHRWGSADPGLGKIPGCRSGIDPIGGDT